MSEVKKIYVYTTKTYLEKGWFKIGQTTQQEVEVRISQQDGTSNPEPLEIIYHTTSILSDKQIHEILRQKGFTEVRADKNREWFEFKGGEDEVKNVINKIIGDSEKDTRKEFTPRFFQSKIKEQFLKKYDSEKEYEKTDFVLELAPRFGKTMWSIDLLDTLFKEYNIKVCVIPTYVLTTTSSFENELNSFRGYSERMVFVTPNDDLEKIITDNYGKKLIIVAMSLHMKEHESKLEFIRTKINKNEKVTIIDEADFGAHRKNSQEKINYLDCGLNIYMTGTAIERVAIPLSNLRDNVIQWSYTDMLMVKNGNHLIQKNLDANSLTYSKESVKNIVNPQFMRLSLGGIVDKFNEVKPEYKTDWNKLFANVNKSKGILEDLIKSIFGVYGGSVDYLIDLNTNELSPKDVTMIFAGTPNKKEQNKFSKLVQETLGPKYVVMLVNSDETSNRDVEGDAKACVEKAKRDGKKVVFISEDMGSRSFSVSEIDTVILMFDRGSYAAISQKVSRALTPGKTYKNDVKINGNIISLSLDPNRYDVVNPIDKYLVYEGEKVNTNELSDGIKRVLNSVNIFVNENGVMSPIIIDEYADKLISSSSLIRVGMETVKLDLIINDVNLIKILTGIEINGKNEEERIEGIDSSKVIKEYNEKSNSKENNENEKIVEDIRQKLKQVLSNIVERVIDISEINNCESNDIISTLEMIDEKGLGDYVIYEVGVNPKNIRDIITKGALSEKLLNTIITAYNKAELQINNLKLI
jgi:hypothetical protein